MTHRFVTARRLALQMALCVCCLGGAARADELTPDQIAQDARLAKRVSFAAPRVFVADLLKSLSAQSGVALAVGERDGSADVRLCVHLRDVPLSTAMNTLWSLLSYRTAEWSWEREGTRGSWSYTFLRPLRAREFAGRLSHFVQQTFENQTKALIRIAQMDPDERQKHVKELTAALGQDDDRLARECLVDPRMMDGLAVLGDVTTPESLQQILERQKTLAVPVSQLPERGKAWVHSMWLAGHWRTKATRDGPWEMAPEPTSVTIYSKFLNGMTSPDVFMEMGYMGGLSYSGGDPLDALVRKTVLRLWMLPGDSPAAPDAARVVAGEADPAAAPTAKLVCACRLGELAQTAPVSVIARLPVEQTDPGSPKDKTIGEYARHLGDVVPFYQTKSRDGVLLVSYPAWYLDEGKDLTWKEYHTLADQTARGNGLISVEDLLADARFSVEQLHVLAHDFAVLDNVASVRPLFLLADKITTGAARILSPRGLPLSEAAIESFRGYSGLDPAWISARRWVAVRIVTRDADVAGGHQREIGIELRDSTGRWSGIGGFVYRALPNAK